MLGDCRQKKLIRRAAHATNNPTITMISQKHYKGFQQFPGKEWSFELQNASSRKQSGPSNA